VRAKFETQNRKTVKVIETKRFQYLSIHDANLIPKQKEEKMVRQLGFAQHFHTVLWAATSCSPVSRAGKGGGHLQGATDS
jgi:hypothetical protein